MSNLIQFPKRTKEGRKPLFVSHLTGTIDTGGKPTPEDFEDRMVRIKASLEKINKLMIELKKQKGRDDYEQG